MTIDQYVTERQLNLMMALPKLFKKKLIRVDKHTTKLRLLNDKFKYSSSKRSSFPSSYVLEPPISSMYSLKPLQYSRRKNKVIKVLFYGM